MARQLDTYERRSIALTLQDLAAKTPAGEPLLVTQAEYRAWQDFIATRGVKVGEGPGYFADRPLKIIDERGGRYSPEELNKIQIPKRELYATAADARRRVKALWAQLRQNLNPPDDAIATVEKAITDAAEIELPQIEREMREFLTNLENQRSYEKRLKQMEVLQAAKVAPPGDALLAAGGEGTYVGIARAAESFWTNAPPVGRVVSPASTPVEQSRSAPSTEKTIPVGVNRGYFEE